MPAVAPPHTPHPCVETGVETAAANRTGGVRPPRSSKPGPRLTAEQRTTVRLLVAQYMDTGTVQAVLQADYPDYPSVSDRYLRQLCHDVATGKAVALADAVQAQQTHILNHGLARKENRVKELQRMYGQVLIRESVEDDPQRRLALLRERRAILSQINQETDRASHYRTTQQPANTVRAVSGPDRPVVSASTAVENTGFADLVYMLRAHLWSVDGTTPLDLSLYPAEAHAEISALYELLTTVGHPPTPRANDGQHA